MPSKPLVDRWSDAGAWGARQATPLVDDLVMRDDSVYVDADVVARLAENWRQDTEHLSNPEPIFEHRAFRQIVDLGPSVIPSLLRLMLERREPWFVAIREIAATSDLDVTLPDVAADHTYEDALSAWADWGRDYAAAQVALHRS